jgi:hypothetical protein
MRKPYRSPTLVVYGGMGQVTLGGSGQFSDNVFSGTFRLTPDPNAPTCSVLGTRYDPGTIFDRCERTANG